VHDHGALTDLAIAGAGAEAEEGEVADDRVLDDGLMGNRDHVAEREVRLTGEQVGVVLAVVLMPQVNADALAGIEKGIPGDKGALADLDIAVDLDQRADVRAVDDRGRVLTLNQDLSIARCVRRRLLRQGGEP
jgi:hypothetical protein